jgi:hypothetical protein
VPRTIDRETLSRARTDVQTFAREVVGEQMWPHQAEVAESTARIRCICSGRQAGKSRTLAIIALHHAFSKRNARVLILSAGEEAAKVLLSDIGLLLSAPLLRGSALEENRSRIVLSNGDLKRPRFDQADPRTIRRSLDPR